MEQTGSKHYGMWSLGRDEQNAPTKEIPKPQTERTPALAPAPAKSPRLSALQTATLLYDYGMPVDIALDAFAKTADGKTLNCKTGRITAEHIDFVYSKPTSSADRPQLGSSINITLDRVGEVSGKVSSRSEKGFQLAVDEKSQSLIREKLPQAAAERGLSSDLTLAGGADIQRIELKSKDCHFIGPHGRRKKGKIVNISQVDALIQASIIPPAHSIIKFEGPRKYAAEVTNAFAIGFICKFSWRIPDNEFSPDLKFSND